MLQILENAIGLLFAVGVVWILAKALGFLAPGDSKGSLKDPLPVKGKKAESAAVADVAKCEFAPCVSSADYVPRSFAVRQLDEGRATLLVRYRPRKKGVTGMLIVWSGAEKRRIQDSYFDLGMLPGTEASEQHIEQMAVQAIAKLAELAKDGLYDSPSQVVAVDPSEVSFEFTPCVSSADYVPRSFAVRQLDEGRATLIARYRPRKMGVTGMLIIWSGAKKRRMQDSYFDLGVIQGSETSEAVLRQFEKMAIKKMVELKEAGMRKRANKAVTEAIQTVADLVMPLEAVAAVPVAVLAAPAAPAVKHVQPPVQTSNEDVKLLRFPPLYRGVIAAAGMFPQERDGKTFEVFGVELSTEKGILQKVLGAHLQQELKNADVKIGDPVEILKLGRKTWEKGKAPMNLYKVTKVA